MADTAELIARATEELEGCGCRICTLARTALAAQAQEISQQRKQFDDTFDELEKTRYRETKLNESISEIGACSHKLETERNELWSKLEAEMLRSDAQAQHDADEIERLEAEKQGLEATIREQAQEIGRLKKMVQAQFGRGR